MRRVALFFIHYCGLAAAVCVLATSLALCTVDPMPRYPSFWHFGTGGPSPVRLIVGSGRMEIGFRSRAVRLPFPTMEMWMLLISFISVLAIGGLAWRLVRLCRHKV